MDYSRISTSSNKKDIKIALLAGDDDQLDLFEAASKYRDNKVYLRASIELSNYCRQNCAYCGNRKDNKSLQRFRIIGSELTNLVDEALSISEVDFVHFSFGEDVNYPIDELITEIRKIYKKGKTVSLVLGELPKNTYKKLFDAADGGPIRYTIKLETTDDNLFQKIKPGHKLIDRLNSLKLVQKIGFKPCSGIIIGIPGQTVEMVAQDLLFLTKLLELNNISASTFIPSPNSLFENYPPGNDNMTLNFGALVRLITKNPQITIPASSSLKRDSQKVALRDFANLLSIHLLPEKYQDKYLIYSGKSRNIQKIDKMRALIKELGLKFNKE